MGKLTELIIIRYYIIIAITPHRNHFDIRYYIIIIIGNNNTGGNVNYESLTTATTISQCLVLCSFSFSSTHFTHAIQSRRYDYVLFPQLFLPLSPHIFPDSKNDGFGFCFPCQQDEGTHTHITRKWSQATDATHSLPFSGLSVPKCGTGKRRQTGRAHITPNITHIYYISYRFPQLATHMST